MPTRAYSAIELAFSPERLNKYRRDATDSMPILIERYLWNVRLCEALYPALHCLEVSLRNALHCEFTHAFGTPYWYDTIPRTQLGYWQKETIHKAKMNWESKHSIIDRATGAKRPFRAIVPGDVIAELTLGFWISLFNKEFHSLWAGHLAIARVFPYHPSPSYTGMRKRLNSLRDLRNRVFHHEPIWYWRTLQPQHDALLETISWLSPVTHELVKIVDRFPRVKSQGSLPDRHRVENFINNFLALHP